VFVAVETGYGPRVLPIFFARPITHRTMSSTKRKHRSSSPSASPRKRKHKHKSAAAPLLNEVTTSPQVAATSLFQKGKMRLHIAVPPAAVTSLSTFIHSHLTSSLLLKHYEQGTIVAFGDFSSVSGLGRLVDECPFAWSEFEGEVVFFNPRLGQRISTFPLKPQARFYIHR
jgi:hypothetical protein